MRILDLSAGNRAIWFDKNHKDTTYIDKRESVNPDVVCDSRELPDSIGNDFDLLVFDPPHVNFGATSNMSKTYGHHTTEEIRDIIVRTAKEVHRVSKKDALMAFKWNDHDQPLMNVIGLMADYWEPLFGHLTRNGPSAKSQTYWVMLRRR